MHQGFLELARERRRDGQKTLSLSFQPLLLPSFRILLKWGESLFTRRLVAPKRKYGPTKKRRGRRRIFFLCFPPPLFFRESEGWRGIRQRSLLLFPPLPSLSLLPRPFLLSSGVRPTENHLTHSPPLFSPRRLRRSLFYSLLPPSLQFLPWGEERNI